MNRGLELSGLDGSNPLAFLAALGTLRTLSLAQPTWNVRMCWQPSAMWRPVLTTDTAITGADVVIAIDEQLRAMDGHPALEVSDNLKLSPEEFRGYAENAVSAASPHDRRWVDFAAAFGCDAVANRGQIEDTALRTMSGAGHQHFLKFMRDLVKQTDQDHLRRALFEDWHYDDPGPSMRWDSADDRRYALRWDDPSGDRIRTVRGANRLAVEALPLFPTMPVGAVLATTGFRGRGAKDTFWTWPIWEPSLSIDAARSLLALRELQDAIPPRETLSRLGVVEVYRSQRLTIGKFRSFTPAQPA